MAVAVVLLPLIAAILAGFFGRWIGEKGAEYVTIAAVGLAALLSLIVFADVALGGHSYTTIVLPWIEAGNFVAHWAVKMDTLSAVMLVVVTVVSAMVHVYSVGYMEHDPHKCRFFAYLSLFTFFMLTLVTANNFAQLFFGWEGVGLASYLLIGFWFHKPSANAAAIKAFLVNRVGDLGLALGVAGVFFLYGSVQFDTVFAETSEVAGTTFTFLGMQVDALTTVCVLLFIGAMGKSAQLFLHTWLPDAMEGPTPVSALIHAATMVTAGVFLVARLSPMYEFAPGALQFVTFIGASTAFFAATIGITQNDIKRVIAYSTCSQLGYMFFAAGVGAYGAAIFHLFTHAFFKALLFLGSGSVIHALGDEQDMRKMGGCWRQVPITYAMMWIGSLALAGIPFFAGYYSKDMVLEAAFAANSPFGYYAYWLGIGAAFLTALYSWRLILMTFHGEAKAPKEVMEHIHESPKVMLVPLAVLAAGAVLAGYLGYDLFVGHSQAAFWGDSIASRGKDIIDAAHHVPFWVKFLPFLVAIAGIAVAYRAYLVDKGLPGRLVGSAEGLHRFLLNKWYFDELYDLLFVRQAHRLGRWFWRGIDSYVIDGFGPDGVSRLAGWAGKGVGRLQTGYVYHYAFAMLIGVVVLISWFFAIGG